MIATNGKSYCEGVKQYLIKTVEIVCPEKAHLFISISLTRNTVIELIHEMSGGLKQKLFHEDLSIFFYCYR